MCLNRQLRIRTFLLALFAATFSLQAPESHRSSLLEKVLTVASLGLTVRGVLLGPSHRRRGSARRHSSAHTFRGFGQFCAGLGMMTALQVAAYKRRTHIDPMPLATDRVFGPSEEIVDRASNNS